MAKKKKDSFLTKFKNNLGSLIISREEKRKFLQLLIIIGSILIAILNNEPKVIGAFLFFLVFSLLQYFELYMPNKNYKLVDYFLPLLLAVSFSSLLLYALKETLIPEELFNLNKFFLIGLIIIIIRVLTSREE